MLRLRLLNEDRRLGYLWSLDIGASVQYKLFLLNVRADLGAVCTDQKQVPAEVDRLEGDVCRDSLENGQEKLRLQSIIAQVKILDRLLFPAEQSAQLVNRLLTKANRDQRESLDIALSLERSDYVEGCLFANSALLDFQHGKIAREYLRHARS